MKRMLIGLTICLVALAFIGGSKGETPQRSSAIGELNQTLDASLARRLTTLNPLQSP